MNCAIYARYSSDLQRQTSIADQIAVVQRYAAERGWVVLSDHIYTDAAISGASIAGRPGLEALLSAAALSPPPFGALLVDDSSRIARDLPDAIRIMQQLTFQGVRLIYVSQGIDSESEQAEPLVAMHGIMDSFYRKEMAAKIKRGLAGQISRGFATGSITYGYHTVPVADPTGKRDTDGHPVLLGKRPEIREVEACVIRRIFQDYASGIGVGTIVATLNAEKVLGPRGNPWRQGAVKRILNNERYLGRLIWGQQRFDRRPGTNQKVARPVPRDQWHVEERPELRIVEQDLWRQVKQRQQEVRAVTGATRARPLVSGKHPALHSLHLFSGFMRCASCSGTIAIVTGGNGSPRYGCPRSWSHGVTECDNRLTVRAKIADALMLAGLREELFRPETVTYLTQAVTNRLNQLIDARPRQRDTLQLERATVTTKLTHLVTAIETGSVSSTLVDAIRAREVDISRIDAELEALNEPLDARLAVLPTWVRRQLNDLADLLRGHPERLKSELRRLGVRFTLHPMYDEGPRPFYRAIGEGVLPCFQFSPELQISVSDRSDPGSAQ